MIYDPVKNPNYAATVFRLKAVFPLPGLDNLVGTSVLGFTALVSKDMKAGDLGVAFTAETQLSDDFCKHNCLYRHENLNADPTKKGFLEDNRRVKAVKFKGNQSSCLFMGLDCLSYLGVDPSGLKEGDVFDSISGKEICRKYELPLRGGAGKGPRSLPKRPSRVEKMFAPEHYDTERWFGNEDKVEDDQVIVVSQKLHGCSLRVFHTYVNRKLSLKEKIAKFLGVKVQETEHDYVFGSRKVVKDPRNPSQRHFYEAVNGKDLWNQEGEKLVGTLPKNCLLFGEIIGWTADGKPLQTGYTYGLPQGSCETYFYRVAFINPEGLTVDLPWDQAVKFCSERGLKWVPEVWRGKKKDFDVSVWMDKRYRDEGLLKCLPLSDPKTVDEGICIRVCDTVPKVWKAKSPAFFLHETKLLDKGEANLEDVGSQPDDNSTNETNQ